MDHLSVVKQAVEIAFSCGKITKLEDIKLILISFDIIEEKLKAPQLTHAPEVKK